MYGLLGKKLGHSFSKSIHEAYTNKEYQLFETNNLDDFFHKNKIKGINVTIPYKKDVISYLDELSPESKEIGVVNTIISKNKKLIGYNTDYYGLSKMMEYHHVSVSNKIVIILGNGSTSRTIQYYCLQNNAKQIIVLARNPKEHEHHFSDIESYKNGEIVFNSTPVGMFPNNHQDTLICLDALSSAETVIDVIYNPLRTTLLLQAKERGLKTVNGLLMLIYQAVKSIELFHNIQISNNDVFDYYEKLLFEKTNLVFIGMPMSGKSFFAKNCSTYYNKTLVEIDDEISNYAQDSISNIFRLKGEEHFRTLENIIISKFSKLNNQAISCGGGVILNKENMVNLKQNGIIIFIDMSLDLLKQCNPRQRPLLKNKENLTKLYNERIPLYRAFQDITITKTTFDKNAIMKQIEVKLNEYFSTQWT